MKKKLTIEDKLMSAKCRELIKGYFDVFDVVAIEVVEGFSGTILEKSVEGIALEYMKREGIKLGITEFLRRIHNKAAIQNDR